MMLAFPPYVSRQASCRISNPAGRLAGSIIIITIMKIYPQNYGKVDIDS